MKRTKEVSSSTRVLVTTLAVILLLSLSALYAGKGDRGGGKGGKDDGPADPVFVLGGVDVMNVDGSNRVTIYPGGSLPKWIPGTNSIIFGDFSDYIFKRISISVVDGEVVVAMSKNCSTLPIPLAPAGTGDQMGERSSFIESQIRIREELIPWKSLISAAARSRVNQRLSTNRLRTTS